MKRFLLPAAVLVPSFFLFFLLFRFKSGIDCSGYRYRAPEYQSEIPGLLRRGDYIHHLHETEGLPKTFRAETTLKTYAGVRKVPFGEKYVHSCPPGFSKPLPDDCYVSNFADALLTLENDGTLSVRFHTMCGHPNFYHASDVDCPDKAALQKKVIRAAVSDFNAELKKRNMIVIEGWKETVCVGRDSKHFPFAVYRALEEKYGIQGRPIGREDEKLIRPDPNKPTIRLYPEPSSYTE